MAEISVNYDSLEQKKSEVSSIRNAVSSMVSSVRRLRDSLNPRVLKKCASAFEGVMSSLNGILGRIDALRGEIDTIIRTLHALEAGLLVPDEFYTILDYRGALTGEEENLEKELENAEGQITIISEIIEDLDGQISELEKQARQITKTTNGSLNTNKEYQEIMQKLEGLKNYREIEKVKLEGWQSFKEAAILKQSDLQYQNDAYFASDFIENSNYEGFLNEDGTLKQEIKDAINAYRKKNGLVEINDEKAFQDIFYGLETEEDWLEVALSSNDVFNAINPLYVAEEAIQNNYATYGINGLEEYTKAVEYLTEEEKKTYNYYYNTMGREKADAYLKLKENDIKEREQIRKQEEHNDTYDAYISLRGLGDFKDYSTLTEEQLERIAGLSEREAREYFATSEIEYMTDDEKSVAIYLLKNEGMDSFNKYVQFLNGDLQEREGKIKAEEAIEKFKKSGAFKDVTIAGKGLWDGVCNSIDGLTDAVTALLGKSEAEMSAKDWKTIYIMQALTSDEEFKQYLGGPVYEISSGIGNMLPAMGVSAGVTALTGNPALGAKVGSAMFGVSAGGNAYESALIEGQNRLDALFYALATGASEGIMEYVLGGIPGLGALGGSFAQNVGKEALQEGVQEIYDKYVRHLAFGEEFVVDWNDVAKASAYGAITSGILNGASIVCNGVVLEGTDIADYIEEHGMDPQSLTEIDYEKIVHNISGNDTSANQAIKDYLNNITRYQKDGISFYQHLKNNGITVDQFSSYEDFAKQYGDAKLYLMSRMREKMKSLSGKSSPFKNKLDDVFFEYCYGGIPARTSFSELLNVCKKYLSKEEIQMAKSLTQGTVDTLRSNYSEEEQEEIFMYTRYTGFDVNQALREGKEPDSASLIDSVIQKTNYPHALVTYRGLDGVYNDGQPVNLSDLQIGDSFHSKAFQSSSVLLNNSFANTKQGYNVVLEILIPPNSSSAAYVENFSGVARYGQMEVIVKRDATMTVIGDIYKKVINGEEKTFIPVVVQ